MRGLHAIVCRLTLNESHAIHDRVDRLRANEDPYLIRKLETGWVVASDKPLVQGHCIFFADPVVFSVNDLDEETRMKYWRDVCRIGDALIEVTGSYRINYETLCNVAQSLHSHILPRQMSEPEAKRRDRAAIAYAETDLSALAAEPLIAALKRPLSKF